MAHSYSSTCIFNSIDDVKDKHITVMGLGLNGGGEETVRFFLKKGAYVLVTDKKPQEKLQPTIDSLENDASLDKSRLSYRLGEHRVEDFANADCVIKNPGARYDDNPYLAAAKAIETDLSIFLRFTNAPVIAVTGSKGKSSTVGSIYYGLKQAGYTCFLGGNITVNPLSFFDEVTSDTPVVLELSSWQLADLRGRGVLKPHISIITKIVPDHQNWYGSMQNYVDDKRLIYKDQGLGDYSIFDAEGDEPGTGPSEELNKGLDSSSWGNLFASESKARVFRYGKSKLKDNQFGVWQDKDEKGNFCGKVLLPGMAAPEIILRDLSVPSEHMKTNVLNAALVLYLMGLPAEKIIEILGKWTGLEHRLQYFFTWEKDCKQYKFYNDTCATVPEATVSATQSFGKPVILIAGGTDKKLVLNPLIKLLTNKDPEQIEVKALYLLNGTATQRLLPYLDSAKVKYNGPYDNLDSLLASLKKDLEEQSLQTNQNASSEVVLFSPGATSFDYFDNEFDRGEQFMKKVKALW